MKKTGVRTTMDPNEVSGQLMKDTGLSLEEVLDRVDKGQVDFTPDVKRNVARKADRKK
ncbi:MAG: hypothetical protein OYL92_10290 [Acidobacteriota bacterium]|nr:hypothetical protein [Acidobacteriota bacterium]MDE3265348.1 hypothetical protein [Acidobacteriota bacterium]